jgi:hypothetical protein
VARQTQRTVSWTLGAYIDHEKHGALDDAQQLSVPQVNPFFTYLDVPADLESPDNRPPTFYIEVPCSPRESPLLVGPHCSFWIDLILFGTLECMDV